MIGGYPSALEDDVEIVELSSTGGNVCPKPADLPEPMRGAIGAYVNGKIIVCGVLGGSNCYVYSFATREWEKTVSWGSDRSDSASAVVDEATWWIAGGFGGSYLNDSLVYNGGTFAPGPELPYAAYSACAVKVNETHVFLGGGFDGTEYISSAYLLEWATQAWTRLPDMKTGRRAHTCNVVGTDVVVVGGYDGEDLGTSEIFSLTSNSWSLGPGVPTSSGMLAFAKSAQSPESFNIVGGFDGENYLDKIFEFDPETYTWKTTDKTLSAAREDHVVVAVPEDSAHC